MKRHLFRITAFLLALFFLTGAMSITRIRADAATLPAKPDCRITYQFENGGAYTIGPDLAMTMMMTNPDGSYYIDPALSYLYPAAGKSSSTFRSTRGDVLQISGIQQSGYLDTEAEKNYLANAIMLQKKEKHKPQVTAGGTYIEIDITNQKLYYYENGVCRVATDIVTGNHRLRRDTPTGVFKVRAKQTNVNLVGKDYVSFVTYWMPIVGFCNERSVSNGKAGNNRSCFPVNRKEE